jgi:hypothetical protein
LTRAVDVGNRLPPVDAEYHCILDPATTRLASVGEADEQKVWVAVPVGAPGVVLTTAVTSSLEVLSQPFTVWLAK